MIFTKKRRATRANTTGPQPHKGLAKRGRKGQDGASDEGAPRAAENAPHMPSDKVSDADPNARVLGNKRGTVYQRNGVSILMPVLKVDAEQRE